MVPPDAPHQTAREVAGWLGWDEHGVERDLRLAAATVWALIDGWVRGRGLPPGLPMAPADLQAVARAATARLATDPLQRERVATGSPEQTRSWAGGFHGFTIAEQMVLNRYRRRSV